MSFLLWVNPWVSCFFLPSPNVPVQDIKKHQQLKKKEKKEDQKKKKKDVPIP
jgi:hypothetical protein